MKRPEGVAAAVLCLVGALLATWPVVATAGWPHNHEYAAPFERVEAFRRAYLALDFFPTWTPFCFSGHGTPSPLIYHRLFNALAGLFAVPLGTDIGTRAALVLVMWAGAVGMSRAARTLGVSTPRSVLLALAFIWSPYAITDWLVRGSFAEFTSMMLVPWLLDAALRQLRGKPVWLPLGLSLAAILHAHQSVGLFLAAIPVVSTILAWLMARGHRRAVLVDAIKAAALAAALTLPWLIAVARIGPAFRLDTLKLYLPWAQYVAWPRYIADDGFAWGATFAGFSVELSRWLFVALVVSLPLALLSGARVSARRELLFLSVLLLAGTVLQFDVATPLYKTIPKAELLQFPWRLVAPLLAVVLLIGGVTFEAIARRGPLLAVAMTAGLLLICTAHFSVVRKSHDIKYRRYTAGEWASTFEQLDGPHSAGEFLPRETARAPARSPWVDPGNCSVRNVTPAAPAHFTRVEIDLDDGDGCNFTFSQFATPILVVEGGTVASGPLLQIAVPAGSQRRVVVRRRNVMELALW